MDLYLQICLGERSISMVIVRLLVRVLLHECTRTHPNWNFSCINTHCKTSAFRAGKSWFSSDFTIENHESESYL